MGERPLARWRPSGEPTVSVVIPTVGGRARLDVCLPTVLSQGPVVREVIVVDDAPRSEIAGWLSDHYPSVRLVCPMRTGSFVRAANLGMSAAAGDFVFLLNDDTALGERCVDALVEAARSAEAGMAAPTMLFMARRDVINCTGIALDRAGIVWERDGGCRDGSQLDRAPFGPSGGAALYARELLADVGLFDESFGAYLEDLDLAWRARLRGWGCAYARAARVLHEHSATFGANSPRKRYLLGRNRIWAIARNFPTAGLRRYLPAIALYASLSLAGIAVAAPGPTVSLASRAAALRGHLTGLATLPRVLPGRRIIQSGRRLSDEQHEELLEPIVTPWRARARFGHLAETRQGESS